MEMAIFDNTYRSNRYLTGRDSEIDRLACHPNGGIHTIHGACGGFHSHGGTQNGLCIGWKIPLKNG